MCDPVTQRRAPANGSQPGSGPVRASPIAVGSALGFDLAGEPDLQPRPEVRCPRGIRLSSDYEWVPEIVDGRKVSRLEKTPAEEPIVRDDIYVATVNGMSRLAITRLQNHREIPTVRGGPWTQSAVRRVLTNPLYMGKVRHNDEVFPGVHEPIVSEELWDTAAAVREAATRTKGTAAGAVRAALT
jgi:hypothetical protein